MKKLILLLFSISMSSQIDIEKKEGDYIINFPDGSKNELYQYNDQGIIELIYKPTASLILTEEEYKTFVKQVKKLIKKNEGEIETSKYILSKFAFSEDIFMATKEGEIATITKTSINKL